MEAHLIMDTVTSVDCGVITAEGALVGHSFNPTLFVSGDVTKDEGVVCDFGTLKKRVKAAIDDREKGIDHKLWVPSNKNLHFEEDAENSDNVVLVTPMLRLSAPADAFVLIRPSYSKTVPVGHGLITNSYTFQYEESRAPEIQDDNGNVNLFATPSLFGSVVSTLLNNRLPEFAFVLGMRMDPFDFKDPLFLNGNVVFPGKASLFRYTHGLPNSSSWGCQNIGHGHMSFIQCFGKQDTPMLASVAWQLASALNGTYFCNRMDIPDTTPTEDGTPPLVKYQTGRGDFSLKFLKNSKMVALPSDTTIENLAHHIVAANLEVFKENGVTGVYISEGLNKGSIVWVDDIVVPAPTPEVAEDTGAVQA